LLDEGLKVGTQVIGLLARSSHWLTKQLLKCFQVGYTVFGGGVQIHVVGYSNIDNGHCALFPACSAKQYRDSLRPLSTGIPKVIYQ
jgi:hypothetical protein